MKPFFFPKLLILIMLASVSVLGSKAQSSSKFDGFSMRVSPGILSFYGDMSDNRYNPISTIKENSKFGFSLTAIKEFNSWIGIQAQYTAGNLYSYHPVLNESFSGSISAFGVSGRFTPLGLTNLKEKTRIQPYATLGLATFGYRSCRINESTNEIIPKCYGYDKDGVTRLPRVYALAIPAGIGVSISINKNLAIDLDHTYLITNTDVLDAKVGNTGKNDWVSLTSVGLRFTIKAPKPIDNLAKIIDRDTVKDLEGRVDEERKIQDIPMNVFVESLMDDVVLSGEVLAINIRINKGSYTGPAKLVQRFPKGFSAPEASSTNGRFSFNNRNVLIEWDNMPADSMVTYTYFIRSASEIAGSQTITGRFEYEDEGKWNTVRFNNYIFVDNTIGAPIDQDIVDQINKQKEQDKTIKDPVVEKPKVDLPVIQVEKDPLLEKEPLMDVEFRIQCGAFRDSDQGGLKIARKYGITEDMREVFENGWYKYTVGSFKSYTEAVEFKSAFIKRTKLYTAFVVAYKNGKRVQNIRDAFY